MNSRLKESIKAVNQLELDLANCESKEDRLRVIKKHKAKIQPMQTDKASWDIFKWLELKSFQKKHVETHDSDMHKTHNEKINDRIVRCHDVIGFYEACDHVKKFQAIFTGCDDDDTNDLKKLIKEQQEIILSEYILKNKNSWLSLGSENNYSAATLLEKAIRSYRYDRYEATLLNYEIIWLAIKATDADDGFTHRVKALFKSISSSNSDQFKMEGVSRLLQKIKYQDQDSLPVIVDTFLEENGGEYCFLLGNENLGIFRSVFDPDFLLPKIKDHLIEAEQVIDNLSAQVWSLFAGLEKPVVQAPPIAEPAKTSPLVAPQQSGFTNRLKQGITVVAGLFHTLSNCCNPKDQNKMSRPLLADAGHIHTNSICAMTDDDMESLSPKAVTPVTAEKTEATSPKSLSPRSVTSALREHSLVCTPGSDAVPPEKLGVSFPRVTSPSYGFSPKSS